MNRVLYGDCRDSMRALHADGVRVQCCVTSPPYFGLRDYGVPPTHWPAISYRTLGGVIDVPAMDACLGLETTPDAFIAHLVEVFRCVRDLLADDGVCWVNIGDSYANDGKWGGSSGGKHAKALHGDTGIGRNKVCTGLKPKDLIGIPWMLAFSLRADGWYLRQDVIWSKPNPMPESVTDRCTKAHEYIFLLAKSERYFFDADAIREPWDGEAAKAVAMGTKEVGRRGINASARRGLADGQATQFKKQGHSGYFGADGKCLLNPLGANKRSVWKVATVPYSGAHFATFPPKLIEPCIMAGSRPGDMVLDPFFGSGTTGEVCDRLGRQWIGCELQQAYAPLHAERTAQPGLLLAPPVEVVA